MQVGTGILFLSTLSLRRATLRVLDGSKSSIISIHALLAESDSIGPLIFSVQPRFLSTLSLRRATHAYMLVLWVLRFLSTLSLRRATVQPRKTEVPGAIISIHALLAESDAKKTSIAGRITLFLSTLSLRRATFASSFSIFWICHFYPRSPCGERP